ncbi:hypothetical protein SAMN05518683_10320 [Salibacterium halotolerans]|uniref:Transposase n=1 Tax=Salibacterium halotolerans TaxID=1884432 RepID=A0A1I5N8H2_9BACI|nr:hypothetical protein SAMN05518683_10320 [Salibacterium halotolerans]
MRLRTELKFYIVNHIEALGMEKALNRLPEKLGISRDIIRWTYDAERRKGIGYREHPESAR